MNISKDSKIRIIGLGKVGTSIAQAFAQSEFTIYGMDINQDNVDVGLKSIDENLSKLASKGKITSKEKDAVRSKLNFSTDLSKIKDADVVIEAVFENMDVKKDIFKTIDSLVTSEEALLLTNTSGLCVTEIASVTKEPSRVAGMHFFNPVPVMKLVEVVRGAYTSDETIKQVKTLAGLMGKTPIVSADSPAFIVNRMLNALVAEAARIVEEGVASVEDVDVGAKLGLGHPMGPFELIDYLSAIGLVEEVTNHMASELGDRFRLPVWVKNLVRAGAIGRRSGRGFYDYR